MDEAKEISHQKALSLSVVENSYFTHAHLNGLEHLQCLELLRRIQHFLLSDIKKVGGATQ